MAVYTDNFTDADDTFLENHGTKWIRVLGGAGVMFIEANQLWLSGSPGLYYYNETFDDKHYSKFTYEGFNYPGPAIRIQANGDHYYILLEENVGAYIGQYISGGQSNWDVVTSTPPTAGDIIEFAVDASDPDTIHYKINGTIIQTFTGKNALSGGRPGVTSFSGGIADDWEGGDVGSGSSGRPYYTYAQQ